MSLRRPVTARISPETDLDDVMNKGGTLMSDASSVVSEWENEELSCWGRARSRLRAIMGSTGVLVAILVLIVIDAVLAIIRSFSGSLTSLDAELATFDIVLASIFIAEVMLKLIAFGKNWLMDWFNILDFTVVLASALLVIVDGSSFLFSARLARIIRLIVRPARVMRIVIKAINVCTHSRTDRVVVPTAAANTPAERLVRLTHQALKSSSLSPKERRELRRLLNSITSPDFFRPVYETNDLTEAQVAWLMRDGGAGLRAEDAPRVESFESDAAEEWSSSDSEDGSAPPPGSGFRKTHGETTASDDDIERDADALAKEDEGPLTLDALAEHRLKSAVSVGSTQAARAAIAQTQKEKKLLQAKTDDAKRRAMLAKREASRFGDFEEGSFGGSGADPRPEDKANSDRPPGTLSNSGSPVKLSSVLGQRSTPSPVKRAPAGADRGRRPTPRLTQRAAAPPAPLSTAGSSVTMGSLGAPGPLPGGRPESSRRRGSFMQSIRNLTSTPAGRRTSRDSPSWKAGSGTSSKDQDDFDLLKSDSVLDFRGRLKRRKHRRRRTGSRAQLASLYKAGGTMRGSVVGATNRARRSSHTESPTQPPRRVVAGSMLPAPSAMTPVQKQQVPRSAHAGASTPFFADSHVEPPSTDAGSPRAESPGQSEGKEDEDPRVMSSPSRPGRYWTALASIVQVTNMARNLSSNDGLSRSRENQTLSLVQEGNSETASPSSRGARAGGNAQHGPMVFNVRPVAGQSPLAALLSKMSISSADVLETRRLRIINCIVNEYWEARYASLALAHPEHKLPVVDVDWDDSMAIASAAPLPQGVGEDKSLSSSTRRSSHGTETLRRREMTSQTPMADGKPRKKWNHTGKMTTEEYAARYGTTKNMHRTGSGRVLTVETEHADASEEEEDDEDDGASFRAESAETGEEKSSPRAGERRVSGTVSAAFEASPVDDAVREVVSRMDGVSTALAAVAEDDEGVALIDAVSRGDWEKWTVPAPTERVRLRRSERGRAGHKSVDLPLGTDVGPRPRPPGHSLQGGSAALLDALLDAAWTWDFDVFALNHASGGRPLWALAERVFSARAYDFTSTALANAGTRERLSQYFALADASYIPNPYHNSLHGTEVLQAVHYSLVAGGLGVHVSELEALALLFSAAVHDIAHPGVNNGFLAATQSELAIRYNDHATLEMHHACTAFKLLSRPDCDFTEGLGTEDQRVFRSLSVELILATDLKDHFRIMTEFKTAVKNGSRSTTLMMSPCPMMEDESKRRLALSIAIKAADLGHPSRPWKIHRKWSDMVTEEFFQQGDREGNLGLPLSPFGDRSKHDLPKSQVGFISFMVGPIHEAWAAFCANPGAMKPLQCLRDNLATWEKYKQEDQLAKERGEENV